MREQIEKNDIINEFPTVDEVNEALEKVKSDIPTVTNEDVFRIDFINIEDSDNIQTSKQNFALLLLKGFSLKGTQVPDNTSIEGKHVPESDYEEEVYYTPNFINGCYSYYFKFSDNSEMKIKTSQAAQLLN